ncbi:MAG: BNR repeat-containing protein [Fibrobacterales bacterium]
MSITSHYFMQSRSMLKKCLAFILGVCILITPHSLYALDIAPVWAGHPVRFDLKNTDSLQYVAYYNADRKMTIAQRLLGSSKWEYHTLPSKVGWDSHNSIEMEIDDEGYIHISGNMHDDPLVYFRSSKPHDISSFEAPGMVGSLEDKVTYPKFFTNSNNVLIFQYRTGSSGSGTTIWNGYDIHTKTWHRLTSKGLFDGQGKMNAYHGTPKLGRDGYYYIVWVWRDSPNANTNHDVSLIKSKDFSEWVTMSGDPVSLPIKISTPGVVVDPVSSGNGLINMGVGLTWDTKDRAVVRYHKYDKKGISQIFNTRWENDRWVIYQTTQWTSYTWNISKTGSIDHNVKGSGFGTDTLGRIIQSFEHVKHGNSSWILDEETLQLVDVYIPDQTLIPPKTLREQLQTVESKTSGMELQSRSSGSYYLRWETLGRNQDEPRDPPYPNPSMLRVYNKSLLADTNFINEKTYKRDSDDWIDLSNLWDGSTGGGAQDSKTVDGSEGWVEFEFDEMKDVTRARIYEDNKNSQVSEWRIQYWVDTAWHDAFPYEKADFNGWVEKEFTVTTNKIRLIVKNSEAGMAANLHEFQCYGTTSEVIPMDSLDTLHRDSSDTLVTDTSNTQPVDTSDTLPTDSSEESTDTVSSAPEDSSDTQQEEENSFSSESVSPINHPYQGTSRAHYQVISPYDVLPELQFGTKVRFFTLSGTAVPVLPHTRTEVMIMKVF